MSDVLYSAEPNHSLRLQQILQTCDPEGNKSTITREGPWGSIAFFENHYKDSEWVETKSHIAVLLGGPSVQTNSRPGVNNTQKILDEWLVNKHQRFDEYVDGPFQFWLIDKNSRRLSVVTDLMGFIPLYYTSDKNNGSPALSSHVDAAAKVSGRLGDIDPVSQADLILNKTITFPYTMYKELWQAYPASSYAVNSEEKNLEKDGESYWLPKEGEVSDLNELARELGESYQQTTNKLTEGREKAALLVSGGEDSRVLMNAVPERLDKTGHVFLDDMNRELEITKKVTAVYGIDTKLCMRSKNYYLDQWAPASLTGGSSSPAYHAHAYSMNESMRLHEYDAVLGGLGADAYLKGSRVRNVHKYKFRGFKYRLDTLDSENHSSDKFLEAVSSRTPLIRDDVHQLVYERRKKHKDYVQTFRPASAAEWSELWPASMNESMANFFVHRRIFRSYEPFLQNRMMKISAAATQDMKINRRLFHRAFKESLKKSWYVSHTKGLLPFFSSRTNFPVMAFVRTKRTMTEAFSKEKVNQDSWADFGDLVKSNKQLLADMLNDLKASSLIEPALQDNVEEEELLNGLTAKEVLMVLQMAVIQQRFADRS